MNLKDFLANREKPPELYWSLVLEKGWAQAGIWYIGSDRLEMQNISPPAAWSLDSELVGACDAALSSSVAKLPENFVEPNKTVFGVPAKWIKDGEIADEYLAQIKEVCTELSLTPVGFVVLPEAIAHLYKSEEGTPLSAVVIGLGSDSLEVSVFKLGNLAGTTTVARSVSLIEDVMEGLSRFEGATPLPSRIIVYDGKGGELDDAKEELMKASWEGMDKIKFLHTPKAEVLASDRKVLATSLAGAAEIGDVSQVNPELTASDTNEDLPPQEELVNIEEPDEPVTAEDLGFMVGEDVSQKSKISTPQIQEPLKIAPDVTTSSVQENEPVINTVDSKPVHVPRVGSYLQKTKTLFHNFSTKLKFSGPKISPRNIKTPVYLTALIILILLISGGVYIWFVPTADITIYVSPKSFQEQVSLSFNLDGKFDESRAIIPGIAISATASGDKTKSTTGTKLIGEKAKGSVQIANGNGKPINLASGTILTSSGGLKYVTNSEASISGQLIPGSPGIATLAVTAGDIGAQYNLAKGEVFKVGVFDKSQVAATSQADFSGGSSQQIAAVSLEDQKKLEQDLKKELSAQVLSDLSGKVDSDQVFVNDLSSLTVATQTYDHKVGDVADTLKLSLAVSGNGVAADRAKLILYATDFLKSKIPGGYGLKSSQISFKFTFTGKQDDNLGYNTDISANFLPLINTDELRKQISGKNPAEVDDYFTKVPGFVRADIKINPKLPAPLNFLPHLYKNIRVDTVADQ